MQISTGIGSLASYQALSKNKVQQEVPVAVGTVANIAASPSNGTAVAVLVGSSSSADNSAASTFMNYMQETPAQRQQDAWLQQNGVSKSQFDQMSAADKQKLLDQMKQEIAEQAKAGAGSTNILA